MPMRGTTIYLYELAWIPPGVAIPVGRLVALMVTAFGARIHVPGDAGRVDPTKLAETAPFNEPGVVEVGPGRSMPAMLAAPEPRQLVSR
jgi:cytochrome c oxidase subunit II